MTTVDATRVALGETGELISQAAADIAAAVSSRDPFVARARLADGFARLSAAEDLVRAAAGDRARARALDAAVAVSVTIFVIAAVAAPFAGNFNAVASLVWLVTVFAAGAGPGIRFVRWGLDERPASPRPGDEQRVSAPPGG